MGLDVDCGAAEEKIEGCHCPEEPTAFHVWYAPSEHHGDGAHADVAAWEGCRRAFAYFLRADNQLAEDALYLRHNHVGVGLEIVAHGREYACICGSGAYGLEVVLRAGAWEELVYHIKEEERGEEDETCLVELVITEEEVVCHCAYHHVVVGIIAEVERFAPEGAAEEFAELERWLASEELVVHIGKDVVEIRILATIIVGLWIPDGKESEQGQRSQPNEGLAWTHAVNPVCHSDEGDNAYSGEHHAHRVCKPVPVDEGQHRCKQYVRERDYLHAQEIKLFSP